MRDELAAHIAIGRELGDTVRQKDYLLNRSPLEALAFTREGQPKGWLRRMFFDATGAPRSFFRTFVVDSRGVARRVFRYGMTQSSKKLTACSRTIESKAHSVSIAGTNHDRGMPLDTAPPIPRRST
jgi:hypothetical protein